MGGMGRGCLPACLSIVCQLSAQRVCGRMAKQCSTPWVDPWSPASICYSSLGKQNLRWCVFFSIGGSRAKASGEKPLQKKDRAAKYFSHHYRTRLPKLSLPTWLVCVSVSDEMQGSRAKASGEKPLQKKDGAAKYSAHHYRTRLPELSLPTWLVCVC